MKQDTMGVLTVDEFELHDFIAGYLNFREVENESLQVVEAIRIVPKSPELFTPDLISKWEGLVNETLERLRRLDGEFHNDAEYTC